MRLLDFATGWCADSDVTQEIDEIESFDGQLAQDASRRGSRLSKVTLPPDYDKHGVYEELLDSSQVRHRYTSELIEFDAHTLSQIPPGRRAVIYNNWSESSAVLKVPGTGFKVVLSTLFKNQFPEVLHASSHQRPSTPAASSMPSTPATPTIVAGTPIVLRAITSEQLTPVEELEQAIADAIDDSLL